MLKVCIDTNVWISGVMFSGKPAQVVTAAFNRKFEVILSQFMLNEIERNLTVKFKFSQRNTRRLINRILQVADLFVAAENVQTRQDRRSRQVAEPVGHRMYSDK